MSGLPVAEICQPKSGVNYVKTGIKLNRYDRYITKFDRNTSYKNKVHKFISYFDLFDYPVKISELSSLLGITQTELEYQVDELININLVDVSNGYCFIPGKQWTVEKRISAEKCFRDNMTGILRAARLISRFPFVRGIILTGTASKSVFHKFDDYDFLIIAEPGRVWLCRTMITLFRRIISLNYRKTNLRYFCCNYYISKNQLTLKDRNEFVALELFYSQPIYDFELYREFIESNRWAEKYFALKNKRYLFPDIKQRIKLFQPLAEFILNLVWNPGWEKKVMNRHYRHWINNNVVSDFTEFTRRSGIDCVKTDFGVRQQVMLNKLNNYVSDDNNNKIRTKTLLKTFARANSKISGIADILLTHAYYLSKTRSEKKIMKPYVPIGPLSVASYLKSKGFSVDFYDTTFMSGIEDFAGFVHRHWPPVVGIYVLETTRRNALEMIKICRVSGITVIAGGPDPSNEPQFYIDNGADLVVVGEGEITMSEIMQSIKTGNRQVTDIKGVYSNNITNPVFR